MSIGSATPNIAVEEFNSHDLMQHVASGNRFTIRQLLVELLKNYFLVGSVIEKDQRCTIHPLDGSRGIFVTSQRENRIKSRYENAADL